MKKSRFLRLLFALSRILQTPHVQYLQRENSINCRNDVNINDIHNQIESCFFFKIKLYEHYYQTNFLTNIDYDKVIVIRKYLFNIFKFQISLLKFEVKRLKKLCDVLWQTFRHVLYFKSKLSIQNTRKKSPSSFCNINIKTTKIKINVQNVQNPCHFLQLFRHIWYSYSNSKYPVFYSYFVQKFVININNLLENNDIL